MSATYGLIFDVDGIIADTEAINARATAKVFADLLNIDNVRPADFTAGLGRGAEAYVRAGAEAHGVELTAQQVAIAVQERQENFLRILRDEPLLPYPGVLELMEAAMAHHDISVGIATSSTREKSQAVLVSAGVPYHRMTYICGSDVSRKKPDPELFLLCAQSMNVTPGNCVIIEDAPDGVQAAKAAGAQCIAVTNSTTAARLAEADMVVDSLTEIDIDTIREMIGY